MGDFGLQPMLFALRRRRHGSERITEGCLLSRKRSVAHLVVCATGSVKAQAVPVQLRHARLQRKGKFDPTLNCVKSTRDTLGELE